MGKKQSGIENRDFRIVMINNYPMQSLETKWLEDYLLKEGNLLEGQRNLNYLQGFDGS